MGSNRTLRNKLDEMERLNKALLERNNNLQGIIDKMKKAEVDAEQMQSEVHAVQRLLYATADMQPQGRIEIPDVNMKAAENGAVLSCGYDEEKRLTVISCAVAEESDG